jgi:hypothetical protein
VDESYAPGVRLGSGYFEIIETVAKPNTNLSQCFPHGPVAFL